MNPPAESMAPVKHAVLVPLRCDCSNPIETWLPNLVNGLGASKTSLCVLLGVDQDDPVWNDAMHERARALASIGEFALKVVISPAGQPRGAVSAVWRSLAEIAVSECEVNGWLVLGGDDVTYESTNSKWLEEAWASHGTELPSGAGSYWYTEMKLIQPIDNTDASCCTFPIVSAAHVKRLRGIFPVEFVNHGADPFLWSMYRRVCGVVHLEHVRVTNKTGGPETTKSNASPPRYESARIDDALFNELLNKWTSKLEHVVNAFNFSTNPICNYGEARRDCFTPKFVLSVDVVVPCYRCEIGPLARIIDSCRCATSSPKTGQSYYECDVRTIIIVDNPASPNVDKVLGLSAADVRVRVNPKNRGASASRNRGLEESMADMVIFIDDDVDLKSSSIRAILDGIIPHEVDTVGAAVAIKFPPSGDVWHEATRMSGITLAFDWPRLKYKSHEDLAPHQGHFKENAAPWCVTAAMAVWRKYAPKFDERYAKTGGGEDVDFCLKAVELQHKSTYNSIQYRRFTKINNVGVSHPFWKRDEGLHGTLEYLGHFFKWTCGDGHLLTQFPQHVYLCLPNVIEISIPVLCTHGMRGLLLVWAVELFLEMHASLGSNHSAHLQPGHRLQAAFLSGVVKNVVDFGHAWFWVSRGRLDMLCHRFDWFCGITNDVVVGERCKFLQRWCVWVFCLYFMVC